MNSVPQSTGYDWLSTGGAYWIIGFSWVLSALFFSVVGMRAAKSVRSENDGCLMVICCTLLAFTGGGVGLYAGLFLTRFPTFVLTSVVASVAFPAIASFFLIPRLRRYR